LEKNPKKKESVIAGKGKTHSEILDENLMHAIAEDGPLEKIKYYADLGADLTQMDMGGLKTNPLRLATIRSNFEIVKYLVEEKNVRPSKDIRVLHMALMAKSDPKEMFLYHIKHGADINSVDPTLGTPLQSVMVTAKDNSDFELCKWVIEQGADVSINTSQGTALHTAVEFGTPDIIGYILKRNKENEKLLHVTNPRNFTPLILAADAGKDINIKYLVEEWNVDVNKGTDVTPLLMAVQHRHISTVQLLISYGGNVNAQHSEQKCTALHLAASNEFHEIISLLIDANAVIDCEDPRGYTPLGMAGTEGYVKVVKMLLEAGANPNHRAHSDNTTAIFHCAAKNRVGVVKLLLEYGADPLSTRYESGETIADMARKDNHVLMADLLTSWVEAVTKEEQAKICVVCYKFTRGDMKRCSQCKKVWYCSAACQKKDWSSHKLECIKK